MTENAPTPEDLRNEISGVAERLTPEDVAATPVGVQHLARYAFAAQFAAGRRVLDLCCGVGYGTSLLAGAGAAQVYGIDHDPTVIEEATRRYPLANGAFVLADATTPLPIPTVELAVCFEGLEHVPAPDQMLGGIRNALAKDGAAIVSTPNASFHATGHSGNPHHLREYTQAEFTTALASHFRSVRLFFQWPYGDPYDVRWRPASVLRALVPVRLKHALRMSRSAAARPGSAGSPRALRNAALRARPVPVSYLYTRPGLRYGAPAFWIALCEDPR